VLAQVTAAWYDRAVDVVLLVPLLLALWGAFNLMRSALRRTVWHRRDRYGRLRRLGTNAQLSFFTSVLGDPPAMRRTVDEQVTKYDDQGHPYRVPKQWIEAVYIDRDFYVHVIADTDETVHGYSVTTRSRWFRPKFRPPGGYGVERKWVPRRWERFRWGYRPDNAIKLGRSRFADLGRPQRVASWLGAHNAHYFEDYYLGNPGYYQTFVYSINDAGAWAWSAPWKTLGFDFKWGFPGDPDVAIADGAVEGDAQDEHASEDGEQGSDDEENDLEAENGGDPPLPSKLRAFRRRARINTYTVLSIELAVDDYPGAEGRLDDYPITFGANSGRVRTLG
jgi:hypothetical protein